MMEKSVSRTALVINDELQEWDSGDLEISRKMSLDQKSEGSSSGYESSVDCQMHQDVIRSQTCREYKLIETIGNEIEIMNYRNIHALCDNLKYILSMPELCDVTFFVGPKRIPVYGVKAILGTRSRVFYNLIVKTQRETDGQNKKHYIKQFKNKTLNRLPLTIDIRKYEPDVFKNIVQFIHCGSVNVSEENVSGLLCGAAQFELPDLEEACWDYIERCLRHDCYSTLIESTNKYIHHKVAVKILSKINHYLEKSRTTQYKNVQETAV